MPQSSIRQALDDFPVADLRAFVMRVVMAFVLLTVMGWILIERYERQRIDHLLHSENAKLLAVQETARVRQNEGLRTHERLMAKLEQSLATSLTAGVASIPVAKREELLQHFATVFDSTPEFLSVELFTAQKQFLIGARQGDDTPVLPITLPLDAPISTHVAARATPQAPELKVHPAEQGRINGKLTEGIVPVMYTTSWVQNSQGQSVFLLVMKYDLVALYDWAERVVNDFPRIDHFRVASHNGMFLIGGNRFGHLELGADRGLPHATLGDVLPDVWRAVQATRDGRVERPEGIYLFRSHAYSEAVHVARNSAYAITILFLPTSTLYATSIFAGFQGVGLIIVVYLAALLIAWGYWRQIRHRHAIEQKEREAEQSLGRLEHATRFGRLGLLEINTVTGAVYANKAFFTMHDKPQPDSDHLKTGDIRRMFPGYGALHDQHAQAVENLLRGGETQIFDYDYRLPSGEHRRFRVTVALSGVDSDQVLSRTLYTDITDLYEQQQQLLRSREQQSSMFKIIAHELRTPASAMKMIAEELPKTVSEKPDLLSTADHLLSVVDDLRITVNPDAVIDTAASEFSLTVLLQEAERQVRALFASSNMMLEMAFVDPDCDRYFSDAYRLRVVLTNLLRNAAYHSGGTRAWVSVDVRPIDDKHDELCLQVDDDGSGIPEEMAERLFSPFERGDTQAGGTGVGLHIARSWIEVLNGTLNYRRSDFGGACFEVRAPLEKAAAHKSDEEMAAELIAGATDWFHGKRVLLVEDDELLQKATARLFERNFGLKPDLAPDGRKGLARVADNDYDLIVTDFLMPNMDGLDMIVAIRESGKSMPIIALTAATLGGEQTALHEAGANIVLSKPLEVYKLATAVDTLRHL